MNAADTRHDAAAIAAEVNERGYCFIPVGHRARKRRMKRAASWSGCWKHERPTRSARRRRSASAASPTKIRSLPNCWRIRLSYRSGKAYLADDAVICSTWSANTAYPGYEKYGWHPDYPYWWINQPWPLDKVCGQTIWLLDDFTEENGGTGFMPGSHLKGCASAAEGVE